MRRISRKIRRDEKDFRLLSHCAILNTRLEDQEEVGLCITFSLRHLLLWQIWEVLIRQRKLSISPPPAVTKQINLLEKDLGLKLFIRTHRGLVLTEAGKSLYKDAKYIIQYCKESVERAKKAMEEKDNIIRIGTSPMTPANSLVREWSKIQKKYPDIKLQMIPYMNSQESAREILKNLGTNIDVVAESLTRLC